MGWVIKLKCFLLCHEWTSKYMQGIKPTQNELESIDGFWHYAKMYCKRCGTESKLNQPCNFKD